MSGPPRAVADVRRAVRDELADLPRGATVLVAVSGGSDSMALAAALQFEARGRALHPAAVVVDHGLQEDSAAVAARTAERLAALGYTQVEVRRVPVGTSGGPEAAARDARYRAIEQSADRYGAAAVLLGHTRDDQAESVLLGLARGSGAGSIFSSSSSDPATATTILGGLPGTVTVLPLSGSTSTSGVAIVGGVIDLTGTTTGQPIARDGTITSLAAFASNAAAVALVGTTVTQSVSLWQSTGFDNIYSPIPGAEVFLFPPLTGIVSIGQVTSEMATGLSIPVISGTRIIVVYAAAVTSGIDTATLISADVGASVVIQ